MYFLILFNPLVTILLLIIFGNYLGYAYFSSVMIISNIITLGIVFLLLYEVCYMGFTCTILIYSWCRVGQLDLKLELIFDPLSTLSLLMIITISCLVYIYSVEYMYNDPHFIRFMLYLLSFSFFMIILVTAGNFAQLLLGWEGIGLLSYLLINFWTTRFEANRAAMKAMIINKIGDFALYLGIGIVYYIFKSLDFFVIFPTAPIICNSNNDLYIYLCYLLILAAAGKSAQIGLHVWLADAMEGPTPVSALIHAATMVTAGIFLLIRCSPILELSQTATLIILLLGSCTAFFSSLIGLVQYDIKKIIAYSTCSQLGYMVIGCGTSNYMFSTYHMLIHAFFKALLFLTAGALIYSFNGEQDLRKLSSSIVVQPFLFICFFIGSLSLIGIPFFSGFYSKEIIIHATYSTLHVSGLFTHFLSLLTIILTLSYSAKIFYFLSLTYYKNNIYLLLGSNTIKHLNEPKIFILLPLIILSICSILSGFFLSDAFSGIGSDIFLDSIYINFEKDYTNIYLECLPFYIKIMPLLVVMISYLIQFFYFNHVVSVVLFLYFNPFILFFKYKYYFDIFYSLLCEFFFFFIYDILLKIIEKTFFEFFGPLGIVILINTFFKKHSYFNSPGLILANFLLIFILLFSFLMFILYLLFLASHADIEFFLLSTIFFYYIKNK